MNKWSLLKKILSYTCITLATSFSLWFHCLKIHIYISDSIEVNFCARWEIWEIHIWLHSSTRDNLVFQYCFLKILSSWLYYWPICQILSEWSNVYSCLGLDLSHWPACLVFFFSIPCCFYYYDSVCLSVYNYNICSIIISAENFLNLQCFCDSIWS